MKPLCFVLMPFGKKSDSSGRTIDFDEVYRSIIAPAIERAELDPIRADEEGIGGSIHKPMFERLMLCEYAVADLTTGNANVFYELGIRHAVRPRSTTIMFHEGTNLPFDVAPLSGIPYRLDSVEKAITTLQERLVKCRQPNDDSPVYQLLDGVPRPEIDHTKADVFRDRVEYSKQCKLRLLQARAKGKNGRDDILALRNQLGPLSEAGVVVDIYLSFRAVNAFEDMLALYDEMPEPLKRARLIREQRAFALTQLKRLNEAETILVEIIRESGPNPETNGLLGRVYKDKSVMAQEASRSILALGFLKKAIDAYLAGCDAHPGVNAVTLMEMIDPPDTRQIHILPVVRYAVQRRLATSGGDYWDHATLIELAVLARDKDAATAHLADATVQAKAPGCREAFAPKSTARNLGQIRQKRILRGENQSWVREIEQELETVAYEIEEGR